ncbi:MAG: Ig-like domain-containing protein [Pseudomonadota bacterium]
MLGLMLTLSGCGGGSNSSANSSEDIPPRVTATYPADTSSGIPPDAAITATFSKPLDPSNITQIPTAFTLVRTTDTAAVPGTVSYSGSIATYTPTHALAFNTSYTATVSVDVTDVAGHALAAPYHWTFTTAPDGTPPTVVSVSPANAASGVALNTAIQATFSELLNASTVDTSSFTVENAGGAAVSGTVSYSATTAAFTPGAPLAPNTSYTATVTTAVQDAAGNHLAGPHAWTFTTGAAADSVPPTIVSTSPADAASGVSPSTALSAVFSEIIDKSTLAPAFHLSGASAVSGTVTYTDTSSGTTALFTPDSDLAYTSSYTATITTGVKDLAGNALASDYSWSFVTRGPLPGALDLAFSGTGKLTVPIGVANAAPQAVAIQPDGKIVTAGSAYDGTARQFALVRVDTGGNLDSGFNGTGKIITAVGSSSRAYAVVVQTDGQIVAAGTSSAANSDDFALVRYSANGNTSVRFSGSVSAAIGSGAYAYAMALQSDGKFVVVGESDTVGFVVARYNTDGSLDTGFGPTHSGAVTTAAGTHVYATAVAIQSDGKIVVAGAQNGGGVVLARYMTDGTLDTTFNGGIATTAATTVAYTSGVAIQADGKIIVTGRTNDNAIVVARYLAGGTPDLSFNGNGMAITAAASTASAGNAIALQSDGKIVVAGSANDGANVDFVVVRYSTGGALDAIFNGTGIAITAVEAGANGAVALAIQPDGKIVAVGSAAGKFAIVRYWP